MAQPHRASCEVVIRVQAAGVTPLEPGHGFSGVVAAVGADVDEFRVGDEVFGMNDWFAEGATAEYCVSGTAGSSVSQRPEAASVPIGALTARQGLFDRAGLRPGERVLVNGGSGAVGIFAVQLAHQHGAYVISTASGKNIDLVRSLGADEVLDYASTAFEDVVRNIGVVFDTVGGRRWPGRGAYTPDSRADQEEINIAHRDGLHFLGDWHTHPEPKPRPPSDLKSIQSAFAGSKHHLNGFVLLIAGTDPFPRGLFVALYSNQVITPILPLER